MPKFPKKQQQCLIPKYLLDYATDLQENHPDPSDPWGGGGGSPIEAGTGIVITGDETKTISVDTEDVAMKTDIPDVSDFITENEVDTKLEDYELKADAFSGSYNDLTDKPDLNVYAETADLGDCAYLDENELSIAYSQITGTPTIPTKTSELTNDSGYITGINSSDVITALGYTPGTSNFSGSYTDLTDKPTIPTDTSDLTNGAGFITSSALSGYATETWVNNQGYLTSVTWSDVSNKPTFATVATSGDYNDLTNKPTIPTVGDGTITIQKNGTAVDTFTTNQSSNKSINITVPTDTNDLTNGAGFITSSALSDYVPFKTVSGLQYINTGSYYGSGVETGFVTHNMLTDTDNIITLPGNKSGMIALTSDIPTVPTKTSDLTNDSGFITSSSLSNYVTTNTAQTITANKTFSNPNYTYEITTNASGMELSYGSTGELSRVNPGYMYFYMPNFYSAYYQANHLTFYPKNAIQKYTIQVADYQTPSTYYDYTFVQGKSGEVAVTSEIPTKTSDLTNDSGFITSAAIPTNYVTTDTAQTITGAKTYKSIIYGQRDNGNNSYRIYNNDTDGLKFAVYSADSTTRTIYTLPNYTTASTKTIATLDDIYYKNGDKYINDSNYYNVTGYLTGSGKQIQLQITTAKSLANITSITVNKLAPVFRGVAGYVNGNAYLDYVATAGYTVTANKASDNSFNIIIMATNAYTNGTNNTPINAVFNTSGLDVTFNAS